MENRWLLAATHPFDLSTLDGTDGFRLDGIHAEDHSGYSVSSAGDFNGDGFDDLIIGADMAAPGGDIQAGETYVVFGHSGGSSSSFDLSTLDGTNGFRLDGINEYDGAGYSVSSADVNGDGFEDLIVGAHGADPGGDDSAGETYVVFGHSGGFSSSLDLSTLDGTNGFRLDGIDAGDGSGWSVTSAGDVNGDGFEDLIIGAPGADPGGDEVAGETYVLFGHSGGFSSSFDLSTLNGSNGFRLDGIGEYDGSGYSANSAGDVNGDGFDDLVIGAWGADPGGKDLAGATYVVFGHSGGFSASLDLSILDGTNGFRLDGIDAGDRFGCSVSSAGDVNGDGFDDLIIGAYGAGGDSHAGETYIVFGHLGGYSSLFDLSTLNGSNGFRLDGIDVEDLSGFSVSSAGDFNGDGYDDLIVGAPGANPGGDDEAGETYVMFGHSGGFSSPFDLSSLDGINGFRLDGIDANDLSGNSVSSAGDFNGDGFDDLIIGAEGADGGDSQAGETYVVFGGNFTGGVEMQVGASGPNMLIAAQGATATDILIGGQGDDLLVGDGGPDVLRGGEGDDTLAVPAANFQRLIGGTGTDTLRLDGSGITLDLTAMADNRIVDVEQIDITGSGNNTLTLDVQEVLNISTHSNTLVVKRDVGDTVNRGSGWTQQANEMIDGDTFQVFTQGAATMKLLVTVDEAEPIDLEQVDFRLLEHLNLGAGSLYYRVETSYSGMLTVQVDVPQPSNSARLRLYDADPVGTADITSLEQSTLDEDGNQRIDWPVTSGETYYVEAFGDNADFEVRFANLLSHVGTTVTVHGTDSSDTFRFNAAASRDVTIDGVRYQFDNAEVETLTFDGGNGADIAWFYDSAGNESLEAWPDRAVLTNGPGDVVPDYAVTATGIESLLAYATRGGNDTAKLHGSGGNDKLKSYADSARLRAKNNSYALRPKKFDSVVADSGPGGNDLAVFNGTGGDETFTYMGAGNTARVEAIGRDHSASGFGTVVARAGSGAGDMAYFTDTEANDVFYFKSQKTVLVSTQAKVTVRAFDQAHATAGESGLDVARIYDTTGDDHLEVSGTSARLYRRNGTQFDLIYATSGFERVKAYSTTGDDTTDIQAHTIDLILNGWDE